MRRTPPRAPIVSPASLIVGRSGRKRKRGPEVTKL
jgi:hypothetical protein